MVQDTSSVDGRAKVATTSINQDGNSPRLIPAMRVARLKRTMDGAKRRKDRLKKELVVCRAIISRKYTDRLDAKGNVVGRNQLTSEQVFGFKLEHTRIEMDLALASRDYFLACKEYLSAVTVNLRSERKSLKAILHDNRIIIQSKKLLQVTVEILKKHGSNGGAMEVKQLTDLALSGDMKMFRNGFLETIKKFDPAHYVNISGVCTVETKIVHSMMDELVELASKAEVVPNAEFSLDVVSQ